MEGLLLAQSLKGYSSSCQWEPVVAGLILSTSRNKREMNVVVHLAFLPLFPILLSVGTQLPSLVTLLSNVLTDTPRGVSPS